MNKLLPLFSACAVGIFLFTVSPNPAAAQESKPEGEQEKPKYPPYAQVLKDAKAIDGVIKLHQKESQLFAELSAGQFNKDFIILMSIAKGIGEMPLLAGWSWGDDAVWQFRKVDDNVHLVRRNVRFKARSKSPEEKAVQLAYTDSVLFSLPTVTKGPSGGTVIDLTPVFMSDLPQISQVLPGFAFSRAKSTWAEVKGFEQNVELEVAATYASGGNLSLDSVPDSRGATIHVHYSISMLPTTGYTPRLADDRVGYFLTVVKDFSKKGDEDRFVRYINRWDLQKADSSAELSPPKTPIIFWLEKTVPFQYRKPIRDGILEWNKAFEKAGFVNAVEVRQQDDDAEWDPEDVNYNTIRWITSGNAFAMGPSRVNPTNGQILDADIIFDADWVQFWKQEYETFTPEAIEAMTGGPVDLKSHHEQLARIPQHLRHEYGCRCQLHQGMPGELAFGAAALMAGAGAANSEAEIERMTMQGLKDVTMHEVGHTLGLRHNFKASTLLSQDELHDTRRTGEVGLAASVMDYTPTNLAPPGVAQGDFFSTTIGPYDMWAIEYGYKPASGGSPDGELDELKKIAARGAQAGLSYATDEDTRGIDPDPLTNRYDLGDDPIAYAKARTALIHQLWPELIERVTEDGDSYQRARQAVGVLLHNHGRAVFFAARYIGGTYVNRDHKGDENARPPIVVTEAEKQRAAITLLEEQVFNDKPFEFPPEMYNYLAATRWSHWGSNLPDRVDYPAHEVIAMWQDRVLQKLLSSLTLTRLHDTELKIPANEDAFTTAELLERLTTAIYSEIDDLKPSEYTNRNPAVSSIRRNLQRRYLKQLSQIALGDRSAPEDCQSIAYMQLERLEERMKNALSGDVQLDAYTQAHLQESAGRIRKVLDARFLVFGP